MLMVKDPRFLRNIALISHGGAGKTSLTDTLLFNAKKTERLGQVDTGTSYSDFLPEEKKRKFSISSTFFTLEQGDYQINLIDTPGYGDFLGDVAGCLGIADGVLLLVGALEGVQVNTRKVWEFANDYELPRICLINKMDREETNFLQALQQLQESFPDDSIAPLQLPIGSGESLTGVVDLLQKKAFYYDKDCKGKEGAIPEELEDTVADLRTQLIESLVETDDELMMKYLDDEEITFDELKDALKGAVLEGTLIPVLTSSVQKNIGLDLLYDYMVSLFPSPVDSKREIKVTDTASKEEVLLTPDSDGPFAALVAKTMVDPYVGRLNIIRVFSGELTLDTDLYNVNKEAKEKIGKIFRLFGKDQEPLEKVGPGDIVALGKLSDTSTGESLSSTDRPLCFPDLKLPKPSLPMAVQPKSRGDEEKISTALSRFAEEDPTFTIAFDGETKELIVTAMGQLHVDVAREITRRKFNIDFVTSVPKVAFKETIEGRSDIEEKYKKQSGGRGQYGHVYLKIEPLPRGKGFEFVNDIFGGAIPSQYIPAVEKGLKEAMDEGVLAGFPVVDVRVSCYDGSYHSVDSSEMAFKIAASKGFKKAMKEARPILLEPIMELTVDVSDEFMGDIIGDLNGKRGKILGMEPMGKSQKIKAQVPLMEVFGFATDLKSITGGQGTFTMEFDYYEKVPAQESEKIIAQAEAEE